MSQQAFDQQANELERARQAGAIEPIAQDGQETQSIGADGDLERSLKRAEAVEAWLNQESEQVHNDSLGSSGAEELNLPNTSGSDTKGTEQDPTKALVVIDKRQLGIDEERPGAMRLLCRRRPRLQR